MVFGIREDEIGGGVEIGEAVDIAGGKTEGRKTCTHTLITIILLPSIPSLLGVSTLRGSTALLVAAEHLLSLVKKSVHSEGSGWCIGLRACVKVLRIEGLKSSVE